jgi:ribosomal protein S18 acetylase RimI-like enzyme
MEILSADRFTFEELTEAYNQTRVDYMVPMPMNVARLREYVRVYDVSLAHSAVAVGDDLMLGLGMLGVREDRGWITRLGVLPYGRRLGIGTTLMTGLTEQAVTHKLSQIWLEVIKGNEPAHRLFHRFGFVETRELIVARRPPLADNLPPPCEIDRVTTLDHEEAIILLSHRAKRANWLNETETMQNVHNLSGLLIETSDGGRGWVTYHAGLLQLTRIIVEVVAGDPANVTATVLHVLHQRHKRQDAIAENVSDDEQWPGYERAGYFDSFRRIEMVKDVKF